MAKKADPTQSIGVFGVGAIVEIKGNMLMICGYRLMDEDGNVGLGHVAVPYPYGFIDESSLVVISQSSDCKLVSPGYESKESAEMRRLLEDVREQGGRTSFKDYVTAMDGLVEQMGEEAPNE